MDAKWKKAHKRKKWKKWKKNNTSYTVITAIHIYLSASQKRFIFALKYTITSIDDEAWKKVATQWSIAHKRREKIALENATQQQRWAWKKKDKWSLTKNKHDEQPKKKLWQTCANVFGEREKKVTNALFKMYSILFKAGASTNVKILKMAIIRLAKVYFQKLDFFKVTARYHWIFPRL